LKNNQLPVHNHRICPPMILASFLLIIVSTITSQVFAQELRYDENTEVKVKGKIIDCKLPTYCGFNCFLLKTKYRVYRVLTTPRWYKHQTNKIFKKNSPVIVVGSKFYGRDGSLCLLAKYVNVLPSGPRLVLWDKENNPVWGTYKKSSSSCMRIFFQGH